MKKRILSILLLCCMVLTLLPMTAFAADEAVRPTATQFTYTLYITMPMAEAVRRQVRA